MDLHFELDEAATRVTSRLRVRRNGDHVRPLALDGTALTLLAVVLDGRPLSADEYRLTHDRLSIASVPNALDLQIEDEIHPNRNTALLGLYVSSGIFCTQCEAEGFRRITYFIDRPDVLSRYTTTIAADRERYPVLLCNGNAVGSGGDEHGRHWARWENPFPKPSYLFALVAGKLSCVEDAFVTRSGRAVPLRIYTRPEYIEKCDHALRSLKKAMRWDENHYGREYDLNVYTIVVVDDFNMGAMENKGLNIFNARYVLASPDTATDADDAHIESVNGHEYFHNWSGNRVTCRDWFQLSLKEGFTVFRDQQFSADLGSAAVKRIRDINILRTRQFLEDSGPLAHPVRPESYQEINNFYTVTVYNKGADVIRMLHRFLGAEGFRRGTDYYFERFDGRAVTTNDFLSAVAHANDVDLSEFDLWYGQAGTPEVTVDTRYDERARSLTLDLTQSCPPSPRQPVKKPLPILFSIALLEKEGRQLAFSVRGDNAPPARERVLLLREARARFVLEGVTQEPVLSALRDFSSPVKLRTTRTLKQRCLLMSSDNDAFSRWNAAQDIALELILGDIVRPAAPRRQTLERVYEMTRHAAFKADNPNRVRALIGTFAHRNPVRFHDPTGDGYDFVADWVLRLDAINPQMAACVMGAFNQWRRHETHRAQLMKTRIEAVLRTPSLSPAVREIALKSLEETSA